MQLNSFSENARKRLLRNSETHQIKLTPSQIIQSAREQNSGGYGQSVRPFTPAQDRPMSVMSDAGLMMGPTVEERLLSRKSRMAIPLKAPMNPLYASTSSSLSSSTLSIHENTTLSHITSEMSHVADTRKTTHDECCQFLESSSTTTTSCQCVRKLLKENFSLETGKSILKITTKLESAPKRVKLFLLQSFMSMARIAKESSDVQMVFVSMSLQLSEDNVVLLNSIKILHRILKLEDYDLKVDSWDILRKTANFFTQTVSNLLKADRQSDKFIGQLKIIKQLLSMSKYLKIENIEFDLKLRWLQDTIIVLQYFNMVKKLPSSIEISMKYDIIAESLYLIKCIDMLDRIVEQNGHLILTALIEQVIETPDLVVVILQHLGYLTEKERVQQDLLKTDLKFVSVLIKTSTTPLPLLSRCLYFCANLSKAEIKHPILKKEYLTILSIVECQCEKYISIVSSESENNEKDENAWILSNSLCVVANMATNPEFAFKLFEKHEILICVDFLEMQSQNIREISLSTQNACTFISNLSYFFSNRSVVFNAKERIGKLMIQFMMSGHEEIAVECARSIGNFTRCESFRNHMVHLHGIRVLLVLLEHHHRDIIYYVLGSLLNLLAEDDVMVYRHIQILQQHDGFLDIMHELSELSTENKDWDLLKLILQVIHNYSCIIQEASNSTINTIIQLIHENTTS